MDLVGKLQHHHSVSKIRKEPKLGGAVRTMQGTRTWISVLLRFLFIWRAAVSHSQTEKTVWCYAGLVNKTFSKKHYVQSLEFWGSFTPHFLLRFVVSSQDLVHQVTSYVSEAQQEEGQLWKTVYPHATFFSSQKFTFRRLASSTLPLFEVCVSFLRKYSFCKKKTQELS